MIRDLVSLIAAALSINPALRTTSISGTGVDLQGFDSAAVVFHAGAVTDGTHTPSVEESDSPSSNFTAVAAADLEGTLAACTANGVQEVGYKGKKRYIRAVITTTGSPSTGAIIGATVVRGHPQRVPA